jgi:hypothetical protein
LKRLGQLLEYRSQAIELFWRFRDMLRSVSRRKAFQQGAEF